MALPSLADIAVPTLVIHARNDPWIPFAAYREFAWPANPRLTPLFPRAGGHVGFHGRGSTTPWYNFCLAQFFERAVEAKSDRVTSTSRFRTLSEASLAEDHRIGPLAQRYDQTLGLGIALRDGIGRESKGVDQLADAVRIENAAHLQRARCRVAGQRLPLALRGDGDMTG